MNLQEAIDAPAWHIEHFPLSFWPRTARPGVLVVEDRLPKATIEELQRRGHKVEVGPRLVGRPADGAPAKTACAARPPPTRAACRATRRGGELGHMRSGENAGVSSVWISWACGNDVTSPPNRNRWGRRTMTFSIIARDEKTGRIGIAVASKFLAVGARMPSSGPASGRSPARPAATTTVRADWR